MTERKKLSLRKPAAADTPATGPDYRKPPVRGTAPRKRMTAAEAAQAREEAAARPRRSAPAEPFQGRDDRGPRDERRPQRPVEARHERPGERRDDRRDERFDSRHDERRTPYGSAPRRDDERAPQRPSAPRREDGRPDSRYERRDDRRAMGHDDRPRRPDARPGARPDMRQDTRSDTRPAQPTRPPAPAPAAEVDHDGRVRLSKLMSERGLASRREADEWIEHGWVRVNGEVVAELGTRVDPGVEITIDPLARTQQAERVTILLHKPIGYVSGQAEDGYEPAVVLITPENRWADDRMPLKLTRGHLKHLAPCGRLDIDSTGLLVLSQDGRIAKHLIGEDSGVEKEYLVRVEYMPAPDAENVSAVVPPEAIERLRFGLELDGRPLRPAQVSWQNEQQLRFVLREGRKRQIRRMCEQVGLKVVGLKRVRMGSVTLGKLPLGQWRFLRPDERF
jgi:23S rRNA pseudouridine2604 synthase